MLVFKESGKVFSLKRDVLKMRTDYKHNTTCSPDAKRNIDLLNEVRFDTDPRVENLEDRNLMKKYNIKRTSLGSVLENVIPHEASVTHRVTFHSKNPDEFCDTIRLIIQEKQGGKHKSRFDDKTVALFDKFLERKFITPQQHKKL